MLRKHVHNNSQSGNVFFIITKLLCGAIFKFKILLQSFRSGKKMRKYSAYQSILYSRAVYLFPKQVHRTICVNLTAKCEQKSRYFICLFDETDYFRDSCNRVKGRQSYSLLNFFVRSKRLQFLYLLIETKFSIRWIHSYQCSTLRLIANRIVSYIEKVQANCFNKYGQIKMRIVLWADC